MWIPFFPLMRASIHGGWPVSPCTHYKSTESYRTVANVHLAIMMAWWLMGNLFLSVPLKRTESRSLTDLEAHQHCTVLPRNRSFGNIYVRQVLVLFLEPTICTVGRAGLRLDTEYHAVNHRELQYNSRGEFCLESDWLYGILITGCIRQCIQKNQTNKLYIY